MSGHRVPSLADTIYQRLDSFIYTKNQAFLYRRHRTYVPFTSLFDIEVRDDPVLSIYKGGEFAVLPKH
jgi:hypothetical protein